MAKRRRRKHVYYFHRSMKYYLIPNIISVLLFTVVLSLVAFYVFHDIVVTLAVALLVSIIGLGSSLISAYMKTRYVYFIDFKNEAVGWKYKFISSEEYSIAFSNINDCYAYQTLGQRILSKIVGAPIGTVVIKQEKPEDPDIIAKDIMYYDKFEKLVKKARLKLREIDARSAVASRGNV